MCVIKINDTLIKLIYTFKVLYLMGFKPIRLLKNKISCVITFFKIFSFSYQIVTKENYTQTNYFKENLI